MQAQFLMFCDTVWNDWINGMKQRNSSIIIKNDTITLYTAGKDISKKFFLTTVLLSLILSLFIYVHLFISVNFVLYVSIYFKLYLSIYLSIYLRVVSSYLSIYGDCPWGIVANVLDCNIKVSNLSLGLFRSTPVYINLFWSKLIYLLWENIKLCDFHLCIS